MDRTAAACKQEREHIDSALGLVLDDAAGIDEQATASRFPGFARHGAQPLDMRAPLWYNMANVLTPAWCRG
jgi:hypothetical protein